MSNGSNKQVIQVGGGGGSSTFLGLTDTPDLYTGQALKGTRVNAGETALEFFTLGGGTGTVTNVSSSTADITIVNPSTTPALTIVSAPKLTTARTINGVAFDGTANITIVDSTKEDTANKDASGGYVGLTLLKINFKNTLNTITSFFINANTIARNYTFPDKDGTVAMTSDITGTNSGTNTGDNATNTQYSGLVTNATHTGDATGATALTLATVNANVGSFGLAGSVSQFVVNAKGLITSAVNVAISIASTAISDFASASRAQTEAELVAGTNITITPSGTGATRQLTIASTGGGGGVTDGDKGDITVTAIGATWTIDANVVTNAKSAQMATNTIKGNNTGATANAIDLTATQATAMLDAMVGATGIANGTKGLVPQPLITNQLQYLRGDGTWASPAGAGTVTSVSVVTANGVSGSVATPTSTPAITLTLGAITPTTIVASGNTQSPKVGINKANTGNAMLEILNNASLQGFQIENNASTNIGFSTFVTGDSFVRGTFLADGKLELGSGAAVADTNLYRSAANILTTDDKFEARGGLRIGTAGTTVGHVLTVTDTIGNATYQAPAGGGGSFSLTETEVDFGSGVPVRSKRFTITDAGISPASKIIVSPSGNVATGRVGNDWEWDDISFIAKPGIGNFVVTAISRGRVRGKRKILYSFS